MTTAVVQLSRAWTQITTGTETKTVSVADGSLVLFDSATAPATDAVGHDIVVNMFVITPPSSIWARSAGTTTKIVVS